MIELRQSAVDLRARFRRPVGLASLGLHPAHAQGHLVFQDHAQWT